MKGILFTGGQGPSLCDEVREILKNASLTAAADSGFDLAQKLGVKPDFILGDMDSIKNAENIINSYPEERVIRYKTEKDYTDTELGFNFLAEKGCSPIIIAGGSGGRSDHLLGIFYLFFRDIHPDIWIMKNETAISVEGFFSMDTYPGEIISLFPLTYDLCRMKSRGLKWELDSLKWKAGDCGISNTALGSRIEIEMIKGRLLLIKQTSRKKPGDING
jgi:thiamine pyrophosphokinase